jgi:hypothetical protein
MDPNTRPVMGLYTSIQIIAFFQPSFKFSTKKISYEKPKNFIWKFEILLGYSAHPTSRARIRLPHIKPHTYSIPHIISNPPISRSNPTSPKQNRLGDFHIFSILSEKFQNPTDPQTTPPTLTQLSIFHFQLPVPYKPQLYTVIYAQNTKNDPGTWRP